MISMVADRLWGSTPMMTRAIGSPSLVRHVCRREGSATLSWADPSGATPRRGDRQDACQMRATPQHRVGSRNESAPTGHLDQAWPGCGRRSMKQVAELRPFDRAEKGKF